MVTDRARHAALVALARQAGRFPDLLPLDPETTGLDARDAAFAHAIYDGVIRRWLTLSHLVSPFLRRPIADLEPGVLAALLAGVVQLVFFDKVPPHAAISTTVEWAKGVLGKGPSGLCNAILRRVNDIFVDRRPDAPWVGQRDALPLSDGGSAIFSRPVLPEDPVASLAIATSHPRGLIEGWSSAFGAEGAHAIALHNLVAPPTILNARHAASPVVAPAGASLLPHDRAGSLVYVGPREGLETLLRERPDVWVQDPASSAAIANLASKLPAPPGLILDLCAGQGTKTRQLALTFPSAVVLATDVDAARYASLERVAPACANVRVVPPREMGSAVRSLRPGNPGADLILLDVPCSNTGVLARRVEARYRAEAGQLARLVEIQRGILREAVPLLRGPRDGTPGPFVLYSTCSLEHAENDAIVDWASGALGLTVRRRSPLHPAGVPGEPSTRYHDGAYAAVLEATGPASPGIDEAAGRSGGYTLGPIEPHER